MEIFNICVWGKDKRLDAVEHFFYDRGYDVYRELEYIDKNSILILPPPVNEDIANVLKEYVHSGQIIYGGAISDGVKKILEQCKLWDYLSWQNVVTENARLTAKGIIKQAINVGAIFEEASCLVTGYGFCGKEIAIQLKNSLANVDVAVRRKELRREIEKINCEYVDINDLKINNLEKYSYIFNSVPALIFDKDIIDLLAPDAMIFDIASKPGGTEFSYCVEKGIYAVNSLGIPGKEYPDEAGKIIANAVNEHIISL
ncbi:MAG: hypothetical protein E7259_02530 [Lachnospiraceae bacterium]|nr:hypothetical protein [Lachnospiraceae bacterium]